jgi:hypothetical protein
MAIMTGSAIGTAVLAYTCPESSNIKAAEKM